MHCARPARPRTTKATVSFGSSLSRAAEPASRPAGKQQTLLYEQEPPASIVKPKPGAFCFVPRCCAIGYRLKSRSHSRPQPHPPLLTRGPKALSLVDALLTESCVRVA